MAGASEQFGQVQQVVEELQKIKPAGQAVMRIIPLKNLQADELSRMLEQMVERRSSGRRSRRYR